MSEESRPVAVVTGASRGAGKGIALALGGRGYTVYVTGRSQREGDAALPGTIHETAAAIDRLGGHGIAVSCDHGDDEQVRALFERVAREQDGRLDILVNNACAIPDELVQPGAFWEKPLSLLSLLNVGMRSNYVASYYAAPLMVARRSGLIVHTSSFGGTCYMHGPAYGAGKAAVDKMAHDMAVELRPHNVAVVSIWMGLLKTERTDVALSDPELARHYEHLLETMESPQLTGLVIDALARDPHLMDRSGRIWIGAELAQQYGIHDADGRQPPSHRPMLGDPTVFSAAVIA
ncbi:MAG: SDR family NAD(P)-dependent oxidoreductase [Gammaproteobacteria bacterium]|nr:SDR family NAD(P)-dependent oxidoreductase [Gammaproteobacteria bacterium]